MSKSTKSQFYRYTLRTVAAGETSGCTDKIYAYPVPPEDALELVGLFVHFRFVFDSAVATADRVIESIGIANQRPLFIGNEPDIYLSHEINQAADVNRMVDIKIDLTDMLPSVKTNVAFTPQVGADYDDGDQTFIYIKFPETLRNTLNTGTIQLWKIDSLYTIQEIR